jgi:hypothetical protein
VRDAWPQSARDEREMGVGVPWFHGPLFRAEVVAALQPIVLVAGALRKYRAERLEVTGDTIRAEARGQAPVQKSGRRMRRPVEAIRVLREGFVLRCEMGSQFDDVESRLGNELECEIERL